MTTKRILFVVLCILCPIIVFLFCHNFGLKVGETTKFIYLFISVLFCVLFIFFIIKNNISLSKLFIVLEFVFSIFVCLYLYLIHIDMLSIFYSVNSFRGFILSTGNSGIVIYILIQALQVVFLPVPAAIIAIAGSIIYGPLLGAIYCSFGVLIGSNLSYLIGSTFGYKVVSWIVGDTTADKYSGILNSKGKLFLPMSFLLPMFPDDILCLISGMTKMNYMYFLVSTTIARPIGVVCMCFFGGGYVIPFRGWGIYAWILISIIMAVIIYFTYRNQEKIENWILSKFKTSKNKNKASN